MSGTSNKPFKNLRRECDQNGNGHVRVKQIWRPRVATVSWEVVAPRFHHKESTGDTPLYFIIQPLLVVTVIV